MVLGEQKHSYILVSVFTGGWGAGQKTRDTDRKDIFIEINRENLVDKLI